MKRHFASVVLASALVTASVSSAAAEDLAKPEVDDNVVISTQASALAINLIVGAAMATAIVLTVASSSASGTN